MKIIDLRPRLYSDLMEHVYRVFGVRSVFMESFGDDDDIENHPSYSQDAEVEFIENHSNRYQQIDPNDHTPVFTDRDLVTLAMFDYRSRLQSNDADAVNAMRRMMYKARYAIKYPQETNFDPEYNDAAQWLIDFYHDSDPTYDARNDMERSLSGTPVPSRLQ